MSGGVFPPSWLFGLMHPSTGAYRLYGGSRFWWENGGLQEGSHQWVLQKRTAASVFVPAMSHSRPPTREETLQYWQVVLSLSPMKSLLFPWVLVHTSPCVHHPRVEFLFPQSCRIPAIKPCLPSKPDSLGASPPIARPPGWGLGTFIPIVELH